MKLYVFTYFKMLTFISYALCNFKLNYLFFGVLYTSINKHVNKREYTFSNSNSALFKFIINTYLPMYP